MVIKLFRDYFSTLDSTHRQWPFLPKQNGKQQRWANEDPRGNHGQVTATNQQLFTLERDMNLLEIFLELLIVVIAVVSLVSNLLVLVCFTCSAQVRAQVPGIFIINLSFCNILITVLNMPSTLFGVLKRQKPFGDHFCQTVSFMDTFLTTNTMLSMAALSIDRWIAVVFPLTYSSKMRLKNTALMVSYAWLHSLAFSLAAVLLSWVDYSPAYASCTVHLGDDDGSRGHFIVFTTVFHACTFALSLFILCFTYLKVLQVARFHCKRIDVITVQTIMLLVDIHPRYI